jgi:hypothetical protein
MARSVKTLAAVDHWEDAETLRRFGADSVVIREHIAGQLLGTAITAPKVVSMLEDLLAPETRCALAERGVQPHEIGRSPQRLADVVLRVVRRGRLTRADATAVESLAEGNRLLYVRRRCSTRHRPSRHQSQRASRVVVSSSSRLTAIWWGIAAAALLARRAAGCRSGEAVVP